MTEMLKKREELLQQREQMTAEINKLNDIATAEKRELTAEEKAKFDDLERKIKSNIREVADINNRIQSAQLQPKKEVSANTRLREFLKTAQTNREYLVKREAGNTVTTTVDGIITNELMPVIAPLEKGLIYDKVGLKISTGVAGPIQWPYIGSVEAEIAGEAVSATETKINITKLVASPTRIAVGAFVSNQAINSADVDLISLVTDQLTTGLQRTLNRVIFSHAKYNTAFFGPFAEAKSQGTFAGAVPTYAELLAIKGAVAKTGVDMAGFCYVMSEALKATLEATPKATGTGEMIVQNGTIGGYPVFCTNFANENASKATDTVEHVLAGSFSYLALNQHGALRLTIETDGKADGKRIWLNSDWSLTTLFKEGFGSWKCKGV